MAEVLSAEFPFVEALPKREKSRWQRFKDAWEAAKARGVLVPATLAATLADVSRQRIFELMQKGTLERVELNGHIFVTESSLVAWLQAPDDKGGRPRKEPPTKREMWKMATGYAKEVVSSKK